MTDKLDVPSLLVVPPHVSPQAVVASSWGNQVVDELTRLGQPRNSVRVKKTNNTQSVIATGRSILIFDTKDYDTLNIANTTTGAFVIPTAGLWQLQVSACMLCNNNPQQFVLELWQTAGGAALSQLAGVTLRGIAGGDQVVLCGSDTLNFTAGQSVEFRVYNNGGNPTVIQGDYNQTHAALQRIT
jgi:hypothetical protein